MLLFQMIEEISSPIDFFTQVVKYDLILGEKNLEFLKLRRRFLKVYEIQMSNPNEIRNTLQFNFLLLKEKLST